MIDACSVVAVPLLAETRRLMTAILLRTVLAVEECDSNISSSKAVPNTRYNTYCRERLPWLENNVDADLCFTAAMCNWAFLFFAGWSSRLSLRHPRLPVR